MNSYTSSHRNDGLSAWRQTGLISLWRYTENGQNYPGWHLSADANGCDSLIRLMDAFAACSQSGFRTVQTQAPTSAQLQVPNNKAGRAAFQAPERLRVVKLDNPAEWTLSADNATLALTIGVDWLAPLRQAFEALRQGKGDFSVGPSGGEVLTLWWQPAGSD